MQHKLTLPAPRRYSVSTESGFYARAWTLEDVLFAQSSGATFTPGCHDFANKEAERAAYTRPRTSSHEKSGSVAPTYVSVSLPMSDNDG